MLSGPWFQKELWILILIFVCYFINLQSNLETDFVFFSKIFNFNHFHNGSRKSLIPLVHTLWDKGYVIVIMCDKSNAKTCLKC